jgi:hypothetical protein
MRGGPRLFLPKGIAYNHRLITAWGFLKEQNV